MKILMVQTSHGVLGNTGLKTGFWLEEFAALLIHSWLLHRVLNGFNGWTHNLEAREFVHAAAVCR